jgi:two-component system OmpR family response regulator
MRLLLVEDSADLARALSRALSDAGYAVDVAATGDDGLFHMSQSAYDAVVLDVMLPGIDGWSVLERARALGLRTPVVMLTARDGLADRVRGLDLGADDYLTKPFATTELVSRLRAVIRRSYGTASSRIEIGDLVLDTAAREVTRDGRRVPLTPREYAIFELLVHRRRALVSRTEIYDHIYDSETDLLSNAIDVHMASLRRKLATVEIRTRRGEGYVLVT